jgi:hypothetical protein
MIKKIIYGLSVAIMIASFVVPSQHVDASRTTRCGGINVLSTPGCAGYNTGADYYSTTTGVTGQNILYNTTDRTDWAIPSNIDTAAEYKAYIRGLLGTSSTYTYNRAGAAFVVNTMMGEDGACNGNFCSTTASIAYAQAHINDFDAYIDNANAKNLIVWNYATSLKAGDINSLHVCTKGTSSANCTLNGIIAGTHDAKEFTFFKMTSDDGTEVSNEIRIYPTSAHTGTPSYRLRRQCGNLIGDTNGLPTPSSYNLKPTVGATVKDNGNTVPGNVAQVGNQVTFTYAVANSGDTSDSVTCTIAASPAATTPATGCPRTFPGNATTTIATENITITAADINKKICRTLTVNPYKVGGGARSSGQVCVVVAAKPFVSVSGGDVSVGNGISSGANGTTCTPQTTASIASWNQDSGGFNGAGAQFAAMALNAIDGFASAQSVNNATAPSGLAFSNTVNNGSYGGSFGSVPCIPDYYAKATNTTTIGNVVNVSSLTTGSYQVNGDATLSGVVNPDNQISVYVNGDAYITADIKYSGQWTYDKIPLFNLVVKGNIYIVNTSSSSGVTQLDGAYVAQTNGAGNGGAIYTCASLSGAYGTDDATFYSKCNRKLTINGTFSAKQIYLLRTYGTLSQATSFAAGQTYSGETFKYNPTLWIAQPQTKTSGAYDAITSLPPIL